MAILNLIFSIIFLLWFFIVAFLIWYYGRKSAERARKLEEVLADSVFRSSEAAVKAAEAARILADAITKAGMP